MLIPTRSSVLAGLFSVERCAPDLVQVHFEPVIPAQGLALLVSCVSFGARLFRAHAMTPACLAPWGYTI